jgi:hypothetical protein
VLEGGRRRGEALAGKVERRDKDAAGGDTTRFEAFAENEVPLGEGGFPLVESFTERKLSAKASRRRCAGEGVFAGSMWDPSRWRFTERPT